MKVESAVLESRASAANSGDGLIGVSADGAMTLALPDSLPELRRRSTTTSARGRAWLIHRLLLLADVLGLCLAFVISQHLFTPGARTPDDVSPAVETLIFLLTLPVWVVMAQVAGLYGRGSQRADHSTVDDFVGIFAVITVGEWLFTAFTQLTHDATPNAPRMIAFWIMAIAFVFLARALARACARRIPMFWQNTIIVGAGDVGQLIARKLLQHPEYGIKLVGFVDAEPRKPRRRSRRPRLLGAPDSLPSSSAPRRRPRDHRVLGRLARGAAGARPRAQGDDPSRSTSCRGCSRSSARRRSAHVEGLPLIGLPPARLSPSARARQAR